MRTEPGLGSFSERFPLDRKVGVPWELELSKPLQATR
jgi:hypothetical protein